MGSDRQQEQRQQEQRQQQQLNARYAYGVEAPLELPSPPPPEPAHPPALTQTAGGAEGGCATNRRFDRYLRLRKWTAKDMLVAKGLKAGAAAERGGGGLGDSSGAEGYMCYQHRNVANDMQLGRSTCRKPYTAARCPMRQPTYPAAAEGCLCCPMVHHRCPPCWGCLLPLSRRRAFGGKLYERETGGTANVFFAQEELRRQRTDVIFKLREGEVTEAERESSRLVDAVGARCGLIRPSVALEWVAELAVVKPLPPNATARDTASAIAAASRRPAIAAELAHGVSVDMLLRSHAQGPNKQDQRGARARTMVHRLRQMDARAIARAAIFDLLFASGDRHLEHVLLQEDGSLCAAQPPSPPSPRHPSTRAWRQRPNPAPLRARRTLIDNAHTILTPAQNTRHTVNSLFLPGTNFFARNLHGFPFLHCCTLRNTCPVTPHKPPSCPGTHTLYWPALTFDYRCHVPSGRIGRTGLPPDTRTCLAWLARTPPENLTAALGLMPTAGPQSSSTRFGHTRAHRAPSRRLLRLVQRARLILERGFEGALRSTDVSPGYYNEGALHNGFGGACLRARHALLTTCSHLPQCAARRVALLAPAWAQPSLHADHTCSGSHAPPLPLTAPLVPRPF